MLSPSRCVAEAIGMLRGALWPAVSAEAAARTDLEVLGPGEPAAMGRKVVSEDGRQALVEGRNR